ncbi:MAG: hypothetical protein Kow0090_21140 [Myxococcota bacterium]
MKLEKRSSFFKLIPFAFILLFIGGYFIYCSESGTEKSEGKKQSSTDDEDKDGEEKDDDDEVEKPFVDESCGTHLGDESAFASVPALEPMTPEDLLGDNPQPKNIHLSWQSEPSISITAVWQTADSSAEKMTKSTVLRISKQSDMSDYIEINSKNRGKMIGSALVLPFNDDFKTIHIAEICGLEPETEYFYQVGGVSEKGEKAFSDIYSFKTAPDPRKPQESYKFKFIVLGDSRTDYDKWQEVIVAAAKEDPAFILHTGDFVESGGNQGDWEIWFEKAKDALVKYPLIASHGNHEWNHEYYYAQFAFPENEQWFSLNYANLHLTVLNDFLLGKLGKLGSISEEQVEFLAADLSATDRIWKTVMHHQPLYSASNHGSNETLQKAWESIYNDHSVKFVFNGHDHNYERTFPIKGGGLAEPPLEGTVYFVAGGAGAPLYDSGSEWFTAKSAKEYHYILAVIEGKKISFTAKKPDGAILDTYEYSLE